ncbi:MAG: hypothetical protein RBS17_07065, partial [Coriobacteriia bacterium]|nr:hypothetical protein [Coriobacteriia bacterium]
MIRPSHGTSSYRLRLLIGFTVVIALFAGTWAWSLFDPLNDAVRSQQRMRLTDVARTSTVAISITSGPLDQTLSDLALGSDVRFTLIGSDGAVLADTEEEATTLENHADRPEVREALAGHTGYGVRRSAT